MLDIKKIKEMRDFIAQNRPGQLQWCAASADKKVLCWCPGNSPMTPWKVEMAKKGDLWGTTMRLYPPSTLVQGGEYLLMALAIDIDDYTDHEMVKKLAPGYSIFTSTSGKGLRLLKRIEPVATRTKIMGAIQMPIVDSLIENGVPVCVYNENMQYMVGGKIECLYRDDGIYRVEVPDNVQSHKYDALEGDIDLDKCSHKLLELLKILDLPLRYGKNYVWIKDIFMRLKDTEYEFKTKSPMQSVRYEINGSLIVTRSKVIVKAFCDDFGAVICNHDTL